MLASVAAASHCLHAEQPLTSQPASQAAATAVADVKQQPRLLTAASTTRRTGATGDATKALLRELNARCACNTPERSSSSAPEGSHQHAALVMV